MAGLYHKDFEKFIMFLLFLFGYNLTFVYCFKGNKSNLKNFVNISFMRELERVLAF